MANYTCKCLPLLLSHTHLLWHDLFIFLLNYTYLTLLEFNAFEFLLTPIEVCLVLIFYVFSFVFFHCHLEPYTFPLFFGLKVFQKKKKNKFFIFPVFPWISYLLWIIILDKHANIFAVMRNNQLREASWVSGDYTLI
jgi:hypothetical protein